MKKMKTLCLFALLISCIGNDKLVIKNISNDDIAIKWYYYSYITNISPEFIDVKKGDSIIQIYKADDVFTDVPNYILRGTNLLNASRGILEKDTDKEYWTKEEHIKVADLLIKELR